MTIKEANKSAGPNSAIEAVRNFLIAIPEFESIIGQALRKAFDEVIDGPRTGRFRVEQLEKTEKTYIGTKVEIVLRHELQLERGQVLDNLICGHEVDTKFSLSGAWMVPREAVDAICLLIRGDDNSGKYSAGLLQTTLDVLTAGTNQDGKRTVSSIGKKQILWLCQDLSLPRNFILDLPDETRKTVLSLRSGKQRILALFRNVTGVIIPRPAILQVAQLKGDPLRRAREAKAALAEEGIRVLCATYASDRAEFERRGFRDILDDDWLSVKMDV